MRLLGKISMMISFTAYANKKFDVLARHGYSISRECVIDAAAGAEAAEHPLFFAQKNNIRVVSRRESGIVRVITFYPVSSNDR